MFIRAFTLTFLAVLGILGATSSARAQQELVADLSDHLVAITTGFTGADVLLFGAIEGEGEIVVVVTGPRDRVTVRRKDRVIGVWANVDSMTFENVPAFYAVATTKPLGEVAPEDVRARQEIGVENINMRPVGVDAAVPPSQIDTFRSALIRNKTRQRLYGAEVQPITVLSDRLFRSRVHFPTNVTTGIYTVSVYYIRDGSPVHAQTTPLQISKVGIGADVFLFAHTNSAAYGLIAIAIAVAAGWLAAAIFRKV
ncbi:MAG: TIGR02186 family protein [Alphaproteobacteria bacterium]|nr:TIGR02186 family protein [Alphaproteobacteria bacterium]